jgi:hypothetical protein
LIAFAGIGYSYSNSRLHALDAVCFRVVPANIFTLLGPSRAGKTTLLGSNARNSSMTRLSRTDVLLLMLVVIFAALARPCVGWLQSDSQTLVLGVTSTAFLIVYGLASICLYALLFRSVYTGERQPSDWGLEVVKIWPLLLFMIAMVALGLLINDAPIAGWGADWSRQFVVVTNNIALVAVLMRLLTRSCSELSSNHAVIVVALVNIVLLYPGSSATSWSYWIIWNLFAAFVLRGTGSIIMVALTTEDRLIGVSRTQNGAVFVVSLLMLYVILALIVLGVARLGQRGKTAAVEAARGNPT